AAPNSTARARPEASTVRARRLRLRSRSVRLSFRRARIPSVRGRCGLADAGGVEDIPIPFRLWRARATGISPGRSGGRPGACPCRPDQADFLLCFEEEDDFFAVLGFLESPDFFVPPDFDPPFDELDFDPLVEELFDDPLSEELLFEELLHERIEVELVERRIEIR